MVISWLPEGRLEVNEGRGLFYLAENIRILTSPKIKPEKADKFVDEEEEIGVSEDRMEGRSSACWAVESTFLLPGIALWPGAQMKVTGIEIAIKVVRKEWIRVTSGWEEDG